MIVSVRAVNADQVFVVYGFMGEAVQLAMSHHQDLHWIEQKERLGTGHAVQQVFASFK